MKFFYTIIILLLFTPRISFACGWGPISEFFVFYNLFDQTNISATAYYPFLRTDDHAFYETDPSGLTTYHGNIQQWQRLLPHWNRQQINKVLFTTSAKEFEQLWGQNPAPVELSARQYISFARKCGSFFTYRNRSSWDYEEILDRTIPDASPLLEEGLNAFVKETEKSLKLRYAYQVIRILHYSKQYQEAIDFFEEYVASKFEKNEIYYYALDQIAGCHYSLENYEYAAYLFVQVFNHSLDRKKSAYLSYNFCARFQAEGTLYFSNADDTIGHLTIINLRPFADDLDAIHALIKIAPADQRTELLFMRALNNVERRIWPRHIGMDKRILPHLESEDKQRISSLMNICKSQLANSKVHRHDFWLLAASYLSFLHQDIPEAKKNLSLVVDKMYDEQKETLNAVYEVFSWKYISKHEEAYLANIFSDRFPVQAINGWDTLMPSWYELILDQAAHLYYRDFKLAKAFLIHNRLETIEAIGSLPLIDDLIAFTEQKEKNEFENILMRHAGDLPGNISTRDYLFFMKGLYYLQTGQEKTALPYLNNSSLNWYAGMEKELSIKNLVPATIFSNNIRECFNCPDTIMTDSVFLAKPFSFIQPHFTKADMASYVIKLDSLTQEPKSWKNKLAHYLLANYYYNVSNTGYFRGTFTGQSNCCSYRYFFFDEQNHTVAAELIDQHEGFNLLDITDRYKSDNGLAQNAYNHYQEVLNQSTDKELNARCLYMMAKCELNAYYNTKATIDYDGYDGTVDRHTRQFKNSFESLKEEYQDTKFYRMIIRECSFFRYYCSI